MGRLEYERLMTADPATGEIPENILQAELQFSNRLVRNTKNSRTQALTFQSAGPSNVGGRTRAVAFDVRDENIIIAGGVSGGIWKSIDGGQTWIKKSSPQNRNSITCLVQDTRPGHENTWYHGTGELYNAGASARGGGAPFRGNGIYKSQDNGESWFLLSATADAEPNTFNSQFQYIFRIIVNHQNLVEDEIFAAAFGGILRSQDGGESWESMLGKANFNLPDTVDLNEESVSFYTDISQSADGIFYATLSTVTPGPAELAQSPNAGIFISRDGVIWDDITPFTSESTYRRIVIGNSQSDPRITYFLIDSNPIFLLEHKLLLYSDDGISQSLEVRETPNFGGDLGDFDTQGSYNMMIKVHPEDEDIVFAGGTNLYRSTDGFEDSDNTEWIGGYAPGEGINLYPGHHPDQHDLLFYPSNPNKILSASDGGLRVSDDGTADSVFWKNLNSGYVTSQFFTIAQSKQEGDPTLIGGMQDNGTDLTTMQGFSAWNGVLGGDGGYAATTSSNLWYASFQRGQTLRLTFNDEFGITSFGRVDPGGLVTVPGYLFVNPFVIDPNNENRMFVAGGNHLYYHPNVSQIPGGTQIPNSLGWERLTEIDTISGGSVSALEISMDSEVVFYGTSAGQLFRIVNASDRLTFEIEDLTNELFPINAYVASIAINPKDRDHLVVVFSNYNIPSIFESKDGGVSFENISGNLEENPDGTGSGPSIRWAEIVPLTSGNLYMVGTSTGLYSTEATGSSTLWAKESQELIGSSVIPMIDYRPSDGRMAIATHGNGVFTTTVSDFDRIVTNKPEVDAFALASVYPNPFVEQASIRYTIPEDGTVKIDVYSTEGELIRNVLWAPQFSGTNEVVWDGNNSSGVSLANGVYIYRILYKDQYLSGRIILNR